MVTGPSGIKLIVLGTISVVLKFANQSFSTDLYVIDKLTKPILGRTAIQKLNILNLFCNQIAPVKLNDSLKNEIIKKYPKIFNSVGNFKNEMQI